MMMLALGPMLLYVEADVNRGVLTFRHGDTWVDVPAQEFLKSTGLSLLTWDDLRWAHMIVQKEAEAEDDSDLFFTSRKLNQFSALLARGQRADATS